jgi:hypothetical protein
MPNIPGDPKFSAWPDDHSDLSQDGIVAAYNRGFIGAKDDPAARERLRAESMFGAMSDAAHANNWADSHAGKLVAAWVPLVKRFPKCLPGKAQQRGSCVVHSTRNAHLLLMTGDIVTGRIDEKTGKAEEWPEISTEGEVNSILQTATWYWFRGYNGDGWSCSTAVNVAKNRIGAALCKNYPEIGVDLTLCNGRNEGLYGSRQPPDAWVKLFSAHMIRESSYCESFEEVRDALGNGYGITTCGGEGFSSQRDENGVSKRSGSWAHAMAFIGADDRASTKEAYGGPLVLVQNSWAQFNSGPRRVMGTDIEIPHGSFWARWSDVKRREIIAISGFAGWPRRKLPDYGGSLAG